MKKRSKFVVVFVAIIFVSCIIFSIATFHKGQISLINKSKHVIVDGSLEICSQHFKVQKIAPEDNTKFLFRVTSDSHYKNSVRFTSGRILTGEFGYVTNGLDSKDTILIHDDKFEILEPVSK